MKPLWWSDATLLPVLSEEMCERLRAHQRDMSRVFGFRDHGPLLFTADGSAHPPRYTMGFKAFMGAMR